MAKSITVKVGIDLDHGEKLSELYPADADWFRSHRAELRGQLGKASVLVYRQEVIGYGDTIDDALAAAHAKLLGDDSIPDGAVIIPFLGFVGNPLPFPLRNTIKVPVEGQSDDKV